MSNDNEKDKTKYSERELELLAEISYLKRKTEDAKNSFFPKPQNIKQKTSLILMIIATLGGGGASGAGATLFVKTNEINELNRNKINHIYDEVKNLSDTYSVDREYRLSEWQDNKIRWCVMETIVSAINGKQFARDVETRCVDLKPRPLNAPVGGPKYEADVVWPKTPRRPPF